MEVINPTCAPLIGIDDESLALILELQRDDGERLENSAKGKQREGTPPSDLETALKLFLEEVAGASRFAIDRRIARSIQTAVLEDFNTLQQLTTEEDMAVQDHRLSLELSQGGDRQSATTSAASPDSIMSTEGGNTGLIEKLAHTSVAADEDNGTDHEQDTNEDDDTDGVANIAEALLEDEVSHTEYEAESSMWVASPLPSTWLCTACGETRPSTDISRATCQHKYCRDCLQRLFEDAMLDETLFPPRCCKKPLLLEDHKKFLPQSVVEIFRQKAIEFSQPNRTYCHRKECQAFLHPSAYVNEVARCGDCDAETCINCKAASHGGDCPKDEHLQQVIALAQSERWQRCKRCWAMVELRTGCYHITCRCGAQFCYNCGKLWEKDSRGKWRKQCHCAQWDEHRLIERAEEIDAGDHQAGRPFPGPQVNDGAFAAVQDQQNGRRVRNVRANYKCNHQQWWRWLGWA